MALLQLPHTCPCHPVKSIPVSLFSPTPLLLSHHDKKEDVSCPGVKYVSCMKPLAWWVAPVCVSEEFGLGPRHQHQLIWVLWVSSKWSIEDTNLHLQIETCPIQELDFSMSRKLHIVEPLPAPNAKHIISKEETEGTVLWIIHRSVRH